MSDFPWPTLLVAAIGGTVAGLLVKTIDIAYQEYRRRRDSERDTRTFMNEHLDPLLKAADELFGKLRSLANEDFKTLERLDEKEPGFEEPDLVSLVFTFARFWGRLEQIRIDGLTISLADDKRGRQLQMFIDCLESRRVRLVDRITQRAIGETMLVRENGRLREIGFLEFYAKVRNDRDLDRWFKPLVGVLVRSRYTSERQMLLQYGIVVHAMVDMLDPEHHVSKDRPGYPHKLTKKTWRDLKFRVFGEYLKSVEKVDAYIGPPK